MYVVVVVVGGGGCGIGGAAGIVVGMLLSVLGPRQQTTTVFPLLSNLIFPCESARLVATKTVVTNYHRDVKHSGTVLGADEWLVKIHLADLRLPGGAFPVPKCGWLVSWGKRRHDKPPTQK